MTNSQCPVIEYCGVGSLAVWVCCPISGSLCVEHLCTGTLKSASIISEMIFPPHQWCLIYVVKVLDPRIGATCANWFENIVINHEMSRKSPCFFKHFWWFLYFMAHADLSWHLMIFWYFSWQNHVFYHDMPYISWIFVICHQLFQRGILGTDDPHLWDSWCLEGKFKGMGWRVCILQITILKLVFIEPTGASCTVGSYASLSVCLWQKLKLNNKAYLKKYHR